MDLDGQHQHQGQRQQGANQAIAKRGIEIAVGADVADDDDLGAAHALGGFNSAGDGGPGFRGQRHGTG